MTLWLDRFEVDFGPQVGWSWIELGAPFAVPCFDSSVRLELARTKL